MNHYINEKTEKWLLTVKEWEKCDNTLTVLKEQTQQLSDIQVYLTELGQTLKSFQSVAQILHNIPHVGQLLGRLMLFPVLLLNDNIRDTLITCMMMFFVEKPTCPVEHRAKLWVISQIKQIICKPDDGLHKHLLTTITGHKLRDFQILCGEKLCEEMLSSLTGQQATSIDISTLCDVCYICLSLRNVAAFDKLFIVSLQKLVTSAPMDELVLKLTRDIAETQLNPYTAEIRVVPLCYDVQILLWSHLLYTLEHEVLDLIEKTVKVSSLSVQNKLCERHLIKACAAQPHIYINVFSILRDMMEISNYHWKLVHIVHMLHILIRERLATDHQLSFDLVVHYQAPVKQLVNLLCIRPKDLCAAGVCYHIQEIAKCLTTLCLSGDIEIVREIHFVLTQFLEWYITALSYSFICDKNVLPCCIQILLSLKGHNMNESVSDEVIRDVIDCLRCLFSKTHLTSVDMRCALDSLLVEEPSQPTQHKVVVDQLLAKVLLVFSVLSVGGHAVLSDVLTMVCGNKSSIHDQFEALLETVTYVTSSGFSLLKINKNIKSWLISTFNHLYQNSSDNGDLSHEINKLLEL